MLILLWASSKGRCLGGSQACLLVAGSLNSSAPIPCPFQLCMGLWELDARACQRTVAQRKAVTARCQWPMNYSTANGLTAGKPNFPPWHECGLFPSWKLFSYGCPQHSLCLACEVYIPASKLLLRFAPKGQATGEESLEWKKCGTAEVYCMFICIVCLRDKSHL